MTDVRVELGLEEAGTVDVTDRLLSQQISISRGRQSESDSVTPAGCTFALSNDDGALTPGKAESPWYPRVKRGISARLSVLNGPGRLTLLDGGKVSTPDSAPLSITGDIAVAIALDGWVDTYHRLHVRKWGEVGDQRSWSIGLWPYQVGIQWSTTGGGGDVYGITVPLQRPVSHYRYLAVEFDADDGAGGHTLTVYGYYHDTDTWETLAISTGSGTVTMFDGTAPVEIEAPLVGSGPNAGGPDIRWVNIWSGTMAGTLVASPDFTIADPDDPSFSDAQGNVWTPANGAEISRKVNRIAGQVASIAPEWPAGGLEIGYSEGLSTVHLSAAGVLRRLGQGDKPIRSSMFRGLTNPDIAWDVLAYWPMEEGPNAQRYEQAIPATPHWTPSDTAFGGNGTIGNGVPGSTEGPPSSAPLPHYPKGVRPNWVLPVTSWPTDGPTGQWNVQALVYIPGPPLPGYATVFDVFFVGGGTNPLDVATISVGASQMRLLLIANAGTAVTIEQSLIDAPPSNSWIMVSLSGDGSDLTFGWTLMDDTSISASANVSTAINVASIRPTSVRNQNYWADPYFPDGYSIGQVIVGAGMGWTNIATDGFGQAYVGEQAVRRIQRLCREEGIPIVVDSLEDMFGDTASAAMGAQTQSGLLTLIQEAVAADLGYLTEDRNRPGLRYRSRSSTYDRPVAVTLDASQSHVSDPFNPVLDDMALRNDVTVTRAEGSHARLLDQESVDREGLYDTEVQVNLAYDLDLLDQAGWRLHLGTAEGMRYSTITVDVKSLLDSDPDQAWRVAKLLEGDLIKITNLPPQHPSDEVTLVVEGMTEQIGDFTWTVTLNCSPGDPWIVGVLGDEFLGRLDTDGSTLDSAIGEATISFDVVTASGPVWIDSAAFPTEFPFAARVGGEVMMVTAIAGTSSPQTFTVTRSANGVVKSHPAGAALALDQPIILAL